MTWWILIRIDLILEDGMRCFLRFRNDRSKWQSSTYSHRFAVEAARKETCALAAGREGCKCSSSRGVREAAACARGAGRKRS